MTANSSDKNALLAQLAWQQAMGINEVLLDDPGAGMTVSMRDLRGSRDLPMPAKMPAAKLDASPAEQVSVGQRPTASLGGTALLTEALAGLTTIETLRQALEGLDQCALKHTASNMVFADGNPGSRVMVVGDVPGREEDRIGLPMVGAAGQLFDRMLASINLSRAQTYVTCLLPWRPPGNRTPTPEEMEMLLPWLYRHIQLAAPDFIFILGGVTAKALIPVTGGILKTRGRWFDIDYGDGIIRPTLATLHPSYLIRSPAQKRLAFADLLALAAKLE
ncbi:uracil-DNA glycosylase [Alphaproteobacteria bacterium]|nr:uracil-DNA glycosylase [Alphaproteobacteria bacterium]